jgi:alkanesulfonate monooxygenase SsuD/methylene tetrahydromethanopterin reductase-like flavin-dependent oxidoreductase (luciferase family)
MQWRRLLEHAERLRFESVWIADHVQSAVDPARHGIDAWMALAVAAAETEQLTLGTLVTPITFRQPALLGRMAEALSSLCNGRFVLGLGLGWNADEHATFGIPFPEFAERVRLLEDGLRLIQRVAPEVPLLIGGSGRSSLALAARYASEWNMTTASAETFAARSAELDRLCVEAGRDVGAVRRSVACGVLVGADADDVARRAARLSRIVPGLSVDRAREMGWIAGTRVEVTASLAALLRAGVERVMFGIYDHDDVDALELLRA